MAEKKKTEFQEMLQTAIDAGWLDLRNRQDIVYPMKITADFRNNFIEDLTDDNRTLNALRRVGVRCFGDLIDKWDELSRVRNMGAKSVAIAHNSLMDRYYQSLNTEEKAKFIKDIVDSNKPVPASV